MIRQLFSKSRKANGQAEPQVFGREPLVPEGVRVYAIGDIHGRADLLGRLLDMIEDDAAGAETDFAPIVIYLGDYIDRGMQSYEVLDMVIAGPPHGFEAAYLKGNHEAMLLEFLDDATYGLTWRDNGGLPTLQSYGVAQKTLARHPMAYNEASSKLASAIPSLHHNFLRQLQLTEEVGDYFFAHAGIRPGVPLHEQKEEDLLWIRDPFLKSTEDFGKIVVHGHTPDKRVQVRSNRIGIDTGAFMTNILTCLVLEGTTRRFLQTTP